MKTPLTIASVIVSAALLAPGAFAKVKEVTNNDVTGKERSAQAQQAGETKKGEAFAKRDGKKADALAKRDARKAEAMARRDAKKAEAAERRDAAKAKRAAHGPDANGEGGEKRQDGERRYGKHGAHPGKKLGLVKKFERLDADQNGSLSLDEFVNRGRSAH